MHKPVFYTTSPDHHLAIMARRRKVKELFDDVEEEMFSVPNPKAQPSTPTQILDRIYQAGEEQYNDEAREIGQDAFMDWLPYELLLRIFNMTHTIDLIEFAKTSKLSFFYARDLVRHRKMMPMYHPINLTHDQARVLEAVKSGDNVFCTGTAGTGKSHLIRAISSHFGKEDETLFRCAPTGTASYLIQGVTLHSTFPPTFLNKEQNDLAFDQRVQLMTQPTYELVKILIIDEISMVSGADFQLLDRHLRRVKRQASLPFGGVQVILFGDFCQIKPVEDGANYCFKTPLWDLVFSPNSYKLTQVVRQKSRADVDVLNDVRAGSLSLPTVRALNVMKQRPEFPDAPYLFTRVRKVEEFTKKKMLDIPGTTYLFKATDSGTSPPDMVPDALTIKTGVRVMLRKNFDTKAGLCNGTMGTVVRFETAQDIEEQVEHNAKREQMEYPVENDVIYNWLGQPNQTLSWYPIVKWDHDPRLYAIGFYAFENRRIRKTPEGDVMAVTVASRIQLPICLGFAMTIDKSQGATLNQVNIDLSGVFGTGREFVALSRAVSLDQVSLRGFNPVNLRVDQDVVEFEKETEWK